MLAIGDFNTLRVLQQDEQSVLLGTPQAAARLARRELKAPVAIGDSLTVFVYATTEDGLVATVQEPFAKVGDFACLKVVDVTAQGAFLDWGIGKDLFVPGNQQHRPLKLGHEYVVAVYLDDETGRVAAASRLGRFFDYDVSSLSAGTEVELLVYDFNDLGAQVVVDERYSGLVYHNELFAPLEVGQRLSGHISLVRPDNKLDIRLRRTGAEGAEDAQAVILAALESAGGFLALHDKSSPDSIRDALGLSKKAFKAAIGTLYRTRKVDLEVDGVRLLPRAKR